MRHLFPVFVLAACGGGAPATRELPPRLDFCAVAADCATSFLPDDAQSVVEDECIDVHEDAEVSAEAAGCRAAYDAHMACRVDRATCDDGVLYAPCADTMSDLATCVGGGDTADLDALLWLGCEGRMRCQLRTEELFIDPQACVLALRFLYTDELEGACVPETAALLGCLFQGDSECVGEWYGAPATYESYACFDETSDYAACAYYGR